MLSFIQIPSNKTNTFAKHNLQSRSSFMATHLGKRQKTGTEQHLIELSCRVTRKPPKYTFEVNLGGFFLISF